ncbi:hypothetical protein R1flu_025036 [Riccia fluitans]|uniref:Uncharacterized protein n=1 Tax=Riccia fluitans TaxID=41844 RepID=A0ABD1XWM9_9MARC
MNSALCRQAPWAIGIPSYLESVIAPSESSVIARLHRGSSRELSFPPPPPPQSQAEIVTYGWRGEGRILGWKGTRADAVRYEGVTPPFGSRTCNCLNDSDSPRAYKGRNRSADRPFNPCLETHDRSYRRPHPRTASNRPSFTGSNCSRPATTREQATPLRTRCDSRLQGALIEGPRHVETSALGEEVTTAECATSLIEAISVESSARVKTLRLASVSTRYSSELEPTVLHSCDLRSALINYFQFALTLPS